MRWVIDSNILIQFAASDGEKQLFNPRDDTLVDRVVDRTSALIDLAESSKATLVVPTPVLSEFLVGIEPVDMQEYIDAIQSSHVIEIVPFDKLAAIECALLVDDIERKQLPETETKSKVRFDRQIIAIAKVHGAELIYTHDKNLLQKAENVGIAVRSLSDVDPVPTQAELEMHDTEE